jgi:hypothetical protein
MRIMNRRDVLLSASAPLAHVQRLRGVMGRTKHLGPDDRRALVSYLRSL